MITNEVLAARIRELRDDATRVGRSDRHPVRDAVRRIRDRATR